MSHVLAAGFVADALPNHKVTLFLRKLTRERLVSNTVVGLSLWVSMSFFYEKLGSLYDVSRGHRESYIVNVTWLIT